MSGALQLEARGLSFLHFGNLWLPSKSIPGDHTCSFLTLASRSPFNPVLTSPTDLPEKPDLCHERGQGTTLITKRTVESHPGFSYQRH